MQPLPLRACQDILDLMLRPMYRNEGLQLWLSFFEIYGGKLYDLLTDRRFVHENCSEEAEASFIWFLISIVNHQETVYA